MKRALCRLILLYRKYISPLKIRPSCRFYPTCSQYALDALDEWGAFAGSALAIRRIFRCNPLFRGGVDYVPKNPRKHPPPK